MVLDTAHCAGDQAEFLVMQTDAGTYTVTDLDPASFGDEGVGTLVDVEVIAFRDGPLTLP